MSASLIARSASAVPSAAQLVLVGATATTSGLLVRAARRVDATERARRLGPRAGWLPRPVRVRLDAALAAADVPLDAIAALQVWLLAVLGAACLAAGLDLALALPAAVAAALGGPIGLHTARHRGARRSAAELPVVLERVASELRTGGTVIGALDALGRGDAGLRAGPLAAELTRVSGRAALGAPVDAALATWAADRNDPAVRSAAGALAVAATTGGRSAAALDGLASSLRDRSEIAAEARALSAQARLSAIVVGSLPVGYLVACALIDPRQVRVLTQTGFGLLCLSVGLMLELLAALWIRALLRDDA